SNTVIAQQSQLHQSNLVGHTEQSDPAYQQVLRQMTEFFAAQGSPMVEAKQQAIGWVGQLIARQATLLAYIDVFRYCAV
ncbi:MAG: EmrB/QacA family drug resistance transporter, partial [Mesorhizobium sp.]